MKKVNKHILKGDLKSLREFVNKIDVQLPNSTLYTIDKAVRDRLREGRYGIDFSEYINLEHEEEHKYHYYHNEMLRLGKRSIQVPFVPHSVLLKEKLAKSPILPENRQTINPSHYKSIREPKKTVRAKTTKKYGSVRKGHGTSKEEYSDWRMRKRATDRLKEKLIENAKNEVRNTLYNDMLRVTQMIRPSDESSQENNQEINEQNNKQQVKNNRSDEDIEEPKMQYRNFQEFCLRTTGAIYPNPVF